MIYSKQHHVRQAMEKVDRFARRFKWLSYDSMIEWKQKQLNLLLKGMV